MTDSPSSDSKGRFFFYVLAFLGVALIASALFDWEHSVIKDLIPGGKPNFLLNPFA